MKTIKLAIVGCGNRGSIFANYAKKYSDKYELTAIVENSPKRIERIKQDYPNVPLFTDYKDFLKAKIPADIVAVATQDESHAEHATALMKAGYDLLLEKPIANTLEGCMEIYKCSKEYNRKVIVCHVLRYTPFYSKVKEIIKSGKLGDIVTIHASENVGYFHQAHSFVRGPWRNKALSSPMILAKCCHDMDIIRYLIDEPCLSVASYGDLYYFKKENAPKNSADYCSDCPCTDCPFKAQKIYTTNGKWFSSYFTTKQITDENMPAIMEDLKHSPYDRCVFKCDNDVVDHQVTIMNFANGKTACHTMTAFSREIYRDIKIHGTKAELVGSIEGCNIEIRYFGGDVEKIDVNISEADVGGHMGGDFYMLTLLHKALNGEKVDGITYLDVSIDSHLMSFGAEESRLNGGKPFPIEK